jgi:glycosyltransferase involved in cell wall biosynthesis
MRILVISNFYPPYFIGGYEWGCHEMVKALRSQGYDVSVLTSTYGVKRRSVDNHVYRLLEQDLGWDTACFMTRLSELFKQEAQNAVAFRWTVRALQPDLIYFWNLHHISISIALRAQRMGFPTCCYVFDNWLAHWERDPWYSLWNGKTLHPLARTMKSLASSFARFSASASIWDGLDLQKVQFASHYLEDYAMKMHKKPRRSEVIHWGIDPHRFTCKQPVSKPHQLLYVGQLVRHKGVHTAIEALKKILCEDKYQDVTLTIAGGTITPEYESYLHALVHGLGLEQRVFFRGFVTPDALPSLYGEHDILIFPSIWEEPFGIVLLEAMSSGLAVVATGTGGSAEILTEGTNALLFPPGRSDLCAEQIIRLLDDPALFDSLRCKGRETVESRFHFRRTVEKVSQSLRELVQLKHSSFN